MLVHLPDTSTLGHMNTPDYQASPDVWDWDAMPDPTIDELAAASTAGLDLIWGWDVMPDPIIDELAAMTEDGLDAIVADAMAELLAFGELY